MSFALSPAGNSTPVTPQQFPNYLQFRVNGVDVGGPDVTVVDFVGANWVITRGTGDNANVLTVSWEA